MLGDLHILHTVADPHCRRGMTGMYPSIHIKFSWNYARHADIRRAFLSQLVRIRRFEKVVRHLCKQKLYKNALCNCTFLPGRKPQILHCDGFPLGPLVFRLTPYQKFLDPPRRCISALSCNSSTVESSHTLLCHVIFKALQLAGFLFLLFR